MSVDKFGRLPRTSVNTDKNHIENLILRLNQLKRLVNDDINSIIGIIPTAIKSKIDAVFKAMFDENPHLTRFTSMKAAFRHILNRAAEIELTAAIIAHVFSILVAKFSEDNLFKPEVIVYMRLLIDQMLEKTKKVEYGSKKDRARVEDRASGDGERKGGEEGKRESKYSQIHMVIHRVQDKNAQHGDLENGRRYRVVKKLRYLEYVHMLAAKVHYCLSFSKFSKKCDFLDIRFF
ncbi:hypothetical protein FQA39_LY14098 [Lamprigera yunnana]|nr:hypothetical protein FQA39_LY14098 [Lamprigera yunnana]